MKHHQWGKINYIEGFITDSDMVLVRQFLDSCEWQKEPGTPNRFVSGIPDPTRTILEDAQKRLKSTIEEVFQCRLGEESQGTIVYYDIGWVLSLHADVYDHLPTYAGYPTRDVGSVLYLSTDFVGGDLLFPDHDILIHPSAGSVAFFPSSEDHLHEVTELLSGNRYTCTSFWHMLERPDETEVS